MKIEDLIIEGKKRAHSTPVKMLLADLLNINSLELLNYLDKEVDEEFINEFNKKLDLLVDKKPIQYVLGHVNFYGLDLIVNDKVLIPRFETEELVEKTLEFIKYNFNNNVDIVDLGSGSGAIALALKNKLPNANITSIDISTDALEIAKNNSERLNLDINFINNDMLDNIDTKYDIIISNPPYIKDDEEIEDIVKDNEPSIALFGGEDGLYYYDKILKDVSKNLKDKFLIAFEIGYKQKEDIINLINKYLVNVNVYSFKDLSEKDRMIFIMNK